MVGCKLPVVIPTISAIKNTTNPSTNPLKSVNDLTLIFIQVIMTIIAKTTSAAMKMYAPITKFCTAIAANAPRTDTMNITLRMFLIVFFLFQLK